MSYTNETTHYGIPLPLGTDLTTPMDYNEAAEAIDEAVWQAKGDSATANENAAAAVETAGTVAETVESLSATVTDHGNRITALAARMTNAENEIDDVRADGEDMITAYKEATATSTHAYAVGNYFIYNNVLYKATSAIAVGATIVPNTNCSATNVATEIEDIMSGLNRGSVSVTADGVKNYSQLMDDLFALIDSSKLSMNSYLVEYADAGDSIYRLTLKSSNLYVYGTSYLGATAAIYEFGIHVKASGSALNNGTIATDGTYTPYQRSSDVPPANTKKFELFY